MSDDAKTGSTADGADDGVGRTEVPEETVASESDLALSNQAAKRESEDQKD
jgi:hypothetical protein